MIISVSKCRIQKNPEGTNFQCDRPRESVNESIQPGVEPEGFLTSTSDVPLPQRPTTSPDTEQKTDADRACITINKIWRNCPAVAIRSINFYTKF